VKSVMKILYSEKGMKIVNILFLLSVPIRNRGIIMLALLCWIVYLVFCIKNTSSQAAKTIYMIFTIFASIMLLANLCFYLKLL
jgi:hypothetical protein